MVELVTGLVHDELDTRPTVPSCMKLHQQLVTLGIRWMPDYKKMLGYERREERIAVDCAAFLDDIRALGRNSTPLKLEQIRTRARLPVIRQQVKPKTLLYTCTSFLHQLVVKTPKMWSSLVEAKLPPTVVDLASFTPAPVPMQRPPPTPWPLAPPVPGEPPSAALATISVLSMAVVVGLNT